MALVEGEGGREGGRAEFVPHYSHHRVQLTPPRHSDTHPYHPTSKTFFPDPSPPLPPSLPPSLPQAKKWAACIAVRFFDRYGVPRLAEDSPQAKAFAKVGREGGREGGRERGREGWVRKGSEICFWEVGRCGTHSDGLDEADTRGRTRGTEGGRE